ncbi:MAG: DUF3343 domain-containing protein [Butyrivibrio crossotus]|jgi:hypothetical protein|nr:DUF3343 domain-containing protein [Butyrivibrio crossotus]
MHIVFFSTSNVFRAEEILNDAKIECKVVPTPVTDKAYCGVCIETEDQIAKDLMEDMEYEIVE